MRVAVAKSILVTVCTTIERALPPFPAATRVEVAD
jgi:hypothetical protein